MLLRIEGDNIARVAAILINVADLQASTDADEPWGALHLRSCTQLAFKGHNYLFDHLADVPAALERLRRAPSSAGLEVIAYLEHWLRMYADATDLVTDMLAAAVCAAAARKRSLPGYKWGSGRRYRRYTPYF